MCLNSRRSSIKIINWMVDAMLMRIHTKIIKLIQSWVKLKHLLKSSQLLLQDITDSFHMITNNICLCYSLLIWLPQSNSKINNSLSLKQSTMLCSHIHLTKHSFKKRQLNILHPDNLFNQNQPRKNKPLNLYQP